MPYTRSLTVKMSSENVLYGHKALKGDHTSAFTPSILSEAQRTPRTTAASESSRSHIIECQRQPLKTRVLEMTTCWRRNLGLG